MYFFSKEKEKCHCGFIESKEIWVFTTFTNVFFTVRIHLVFPFFPGQRKSCNYRRFNRILPQLNGLSPDLLLVALQQPQECDFHRGCESRGDKDGRGWHIMCQWRHVAVAFCCFMSRFSQYFAHFPQFKSCLSTWLGSGDCRSANWQLRCWLSIIPHIIAS